MEQFSANNEFNLERLLLTRSFNDLSEDEKGFILSQMTADEYDACREVVTGSRKTFADEFAVNRPDPVILGRLQQAMHRKETNRYRFYEIIRSIFTFRIPLYQPALAFTALLFILLILRGKDFETVRYIARTDTVYLEKQSPAPVADPKYSVKEKEAGAIPEKTFRQDRKEREKGTVQSQRQPSRDQYVRSSYEKIHLLAQSRKGSSARDDSSLMRLLVTAN